VERNEENFSFYSQTTMIFVTKSARMKNFATNESLRAIAAKRFSHS
jgi:hypothetical protein